MLLILAGVTIAALTGSDSAPSKANEASQKQDIGAAKDDVSLAVTNAITDAYQTAYVANGVSAGDASTTVGTEVIKAIAQKYQTNNQIGKATIEIDGFGSISTVTGNATVTISTTDFVIEGTIYKDGGKLTWGEIQLNQPSIKITNAPETLDVGKNVTLQTEIKRVTDTPAITWSSNDIDEEIATVNNTGKVTGVAIGDIIITATISVGGINYTDSCTITIQDPPPPPQKGDFVEYQAGSWTIDDFKLLGVTFKKDPVTGEDTNEMDSLGSYYAGSTMTKTNRKFSGFGLGDSKDVSRTPTDTTAVSSGLEQGWRILETTTGEDGTVYVTKIIHAGTPEGFYHPGSGSSSSANAMKNRNWSMYVNTEYYGKTAASLTYDEAVNITGNAFTSNDLLRKTGNYYWLPYSTVANDTFYAVRDVGWIEGKAMQGGTRSDYLYGVRPVVVLDSNVTVTGTGSTHNTYATRWTLTKNQ